MDSRRIDPVSDRSSASDGLQKLIQTQHPGIASELQGAINTLRKLQWIAGSGPVPDTVDDAARATLVQTGGDNVTSTLVPLPGFELPTFHAGDSFGRYQIVRLLGKGAMGAVYLSYDGQLERHVALKLPMLSTAEMIERFHREARVAAKLRSPYICPVFDVGNSNGMNYISMAYIDGVPLSNHIREKRLKQADDIAQLVSKIARGLTKAHEAGVVHRDLKPDNIMVDMDGEPILMDFGLARNMEEDIRISKSGALTGSPAYMSPEQAQGDQSKVGPPTDIYSLGVILFEILTGRIPFQGSIVSVLQKIVNESPPRPSIMRSEILQDPHLKRLEELALKMMSKRPSDRFASAAQVADAMDNYLRIDGRASAQARGPAWKRVFWPFARK